MDTRRRKQRTEELVRAVRQLERAAAQPTDEFIRDSVIQRFEFAYELVWKLLKLRLEEEGILVQAPRQALQEALQVGFITDGNMWSEIQRYRNLTSHTSDEKLADEVYAFVRAEALPRLRALSALAAVWP